MGPKTERVDATREELAAAEYAYLSSLRADAMKNVNDRRRIAAGT